MQKMMTEEELLHKLYDKPAVLFSRKGLKLVKSCSPH